MKQFTIILLSLLSLTTAFAQNKYALSGTMIDSLSHEKIFYATIGLLTPDSNARVVANTFSGADGRFTLADISAGDYVLKVSLVGYDMLSIPVSVKGDQRKIELGEVMMKKVSNDLQEVTVKGEKPVYMMDGEKTLYNVSDDPTVQSGTAADALQNAPGVEVDVEGNITLRGVSSVEIWLNNKPSNMNEEALKQFIQQMPAGTIEKIEVITNPSARYSAKGSGGIINIVTASKIKKNSFFSFGVRGSSTPNVSPFLSYVYANEKFSFSAYANYRYSITKSRGSSEGTTFNNEGDTAEFSSSEYDWKNRTHSPGLYLHASYDPDTMNTFYFWGGMYPSFDNSFSNGSCIWHRYLYDVGDFSYNSTSSSKSTGFGGYGGLWYEHKFNSKGHKISFDVNYSGWLSKYSSSDNRDYTFYNRDKLRLENQRYAMNNTSASVDYTIPYHENGEIEMGVSGSYGRTNKYYYLDTLVFGTDSDLERDMLRSYDCLTQNYGGEGYVTIQHRFGNFTIKGGLRTEYEGYDLKFISAPQYDMRKGYWGLFPSLHLSYRTKSMHNFKLSYTRRVDNPSTDELSPFIFYDEDSYRTGNPDLRQAYTNSLEAGWTKFFPKFGNVSINAYFKNTKDEYSNLTDVAYDPFFGRIVSFSKPINAGKSLNTGLEASVMYRLKAFMNIRFYANMYYAKTSFQFRDEADPYTVENLGYSFRLNFWAKLWKVLEVNASANYHSKSKSLFTVTQPRYSIDCGLRAEFWKRRISVHLDVTDIFNWNKETSISNNPYYVTSNTSWNSWFGRSIRAGVTFKFGKMELESQANQGGGMQSQGM